MYPDHPRHDLYRRLTAQQYAALQDAAKARAQDLRDEAIDAACAAVAGALRRAWRSARHLARRAERVVSIGHHARG